MRTRISAPTSTAWSGSTRISSAGWTSTGSRAASCSAWTSPTGTPGGRGLPPIADDLARVVDRYPEAQLIVAHAGIADLAALADRLGGKAGMFFDTSVWSPLDLLGLYRLVGPEQVVYASDYPYGQQPASLLISLRTARLAQLNDEQVRGVLAGNANRIAGGEPPLEPTAPKGTDTFSQPMALARIHQYLSMATPLLWTRQQDRIGVLGPALNAY